MKSGLKRSAATISWRPTLQEVRTAACRARPGYGTISQGYLESSNVNVVQEITNLITAQRAYELNSKVIEAADQMMQTTSQIR